MALERSPEFKGDIFFQIVCAVVIQKVFMAFNQNRLRNLLLCLMGLLLNCSGLL